MIIPFIFDWPFHAALMQRLEPCAGVPNEPATDESAFVLVIANALEPHVKRNAETCVSCEVKDAIE